MALLSIGLTVASLIAAHDLWVPSERGARDQIALFNAATSATVLIGVVSLVALMLLTLVGAALVITPDAFAEAVGMDAGFGDYLELAWFVSSLGTIDGALGAGLESDAAVREAAYTYRGEDH